MRWSLPTVTAIVVALAAGLPAVASAVRLASYSCTLGEGGSWGGDTPPDQVTLYLKHDYEPMQPASPVYCGYANPTFWNNGDSGTLDFTTSDATGFDATVGRITDGANDWLFAEARLAAGTHTIGSSRYATEQYFLSHTPDLIGYQIDLIRLIVHDVTMWVDDQGRFRFEVPVTWEFWGIPEPATFALLAAGALFGRPYRR